MSIEENLRLFCKVLEIEPAGEEVEKILDSLNSVTGYSKNDLMTLASKNLNVDFISRIKIREAVEDDAVKLARFENYYFLGQPLESLDDNIKVNEEHWLDVINDKNQYSYLAEERELGIGIVGYILGLKNEIGLVCVHERFRYKKGELGYRIGSLLILKVLSLIKENGFKEAFADYARNKGPALLEGLNFSKIPKNEVTERHLEPPAYRYKFK